MDSQLTIQMGAFEADQLWINKNLTALLEKYSEQWIAVKEGKVIASAPILDELIAKLQDPAETSVEFITREPLNMVL